MTVNGLGRASLQGDLGFVDLLAAMGADLDQNEGATTVRGTGTLHGIDIDLRHLSDTVATYTVTPQVSLAGNYDYGQDKESGATVKWQGFAGYLRYQPTAWFALSPRSEFYNDREGFTSGMAQKMKEFTLTAELKHKDGVVTRLEYRRDFSDIPFFVMNATNTQHQNTFTVSLIYAFSTKAP